jgi:hypothetical protein
MLEALESALDSLEATGALQSQQRVGIKALLNPPEESRTMEETSDEDICQGVLAACNVEDCKAEGSPRVSCEMRKRRVKPGHVPEGRTRTRVTGGGVRGLLSPLAQVCDGSTTVYTRG